MDKRVIPVIADLWNRYKDKEDIYGMYVTEKALHGKYPKRRVWKKVYRELFIDNKNRNRHGIYSKY